MILDRHPDIQRLSPSDKLTLVTELWDELAAHPSSVPVSPEQIAELDRRLGEYRKHPTRVTTWEAIKERVLGRSGMSQLVFLLSADVDIQQAFAAYEESRE